MKVPQLPTEDDGGGDRGDAVCHSADRDPGRKLARDPCDMARALSLTDGKGSYRLPHGLRCECRSGGIMAAEIAVYLLLA